MPKEFLDKPGNAPLLRSALLAGTNHADAKAGVGYTSGVDPELFKLWHEDQVAQHAPLADLVSIVDPKDAEKADPTEYGFELGLKRLAEDSENTSSAEEGSTVTHEGPVTAEEMAAHSDTPNDDSPRGDPDMVQVAHTQTPATSLVGGHEEA